MSGRPKRKAAVRVFKIVDSDSDEDYNVKPPKKKKVSTRKPTGPTVATDATKNKAADENTPVATDAAAKLPKPNIQKKTATKNKAAEENTQVATDTAAKLPKSNTQKKSATKNKAADENTPPSNIGNDCEVLSTVDLCSDDEPDGQTYSREQNNEQETISQQKQSPRIQGRNSFWARRKVWTIDELLAESACIQPRAAKNIVNLFENENTIPFICRYRRDLIDHIEPEQLREIKNTYTEIVCLRKKAETIVTTLEKENVDEHIRTEILCAKSAEELEYLYSPFKPASKGTLAQRAKALGLEVYADRLLYGEYPQVKIMNIIDTKNTDLDTEDKVVNGICHIISHNISKHTGVLEEITKLQNKHRITLKTSKAKDPSSTSSSSLKKKESTKVKASTSTAAAADHSGYSGKNKNDASKYETYYDYSNDVRYLKPHQVLAINRAENLKFLSVKITVSDNFRDDLELYVRNIFLNDGIKYPLRVQIFNKSFEECYAKKLLPLLSRQIRSNLIEKAKKASIEVFARNLKQLLLTAPLKGERILGIDPGYRNGCKYAMISETADVLETGVYYPHLRDEDPEKWGEKLCKTLTQHDCYLIALGNGTACRSTEIWLEKLFSLQILDRHRIRYSIVSEQGASIYSCSELAKKEFPNMDMNLISAVSIARRLNDPLSELVKIEPRHIGVGMYQHDINEKKLSESLSDVVSECVSYVGVDINTASITVLKHIAGLSQKKAEKILQYRTENGPFKQRKDLLKVKSIGSRTFLQCAGFIRIDPRSIDFPVPNLLDCTGVHPESYDIAEKIIAKCKLEIKNIGSPSFIEKIEDFCKTCNMDALAKEFKTPAERLDVLLQSLKRELFQDYRIDIGQRPLFKQGITHMKDVSVFDVLTGSVINITHFGAFVDVGMEFAGLIHISKMNNANLQIGDRVTVSVISIDVKTKRLGLRLEEMLVETDTSFTLCST